MSGGKPGAVLQEHPLPCWALFYRLSTPFSATCEGKEGEEQKQDDTEQQVRRKRRGKHAVHLHRDMHLRIPCLFYKERSQELVFLAGEMAQGVERAGYTSRGPGFNPHYLHGSLQPFLSRDQSIQCLHRHQAHKSGTKTIR